MKDKKIKRELKLLRIAIQRQENYLERICSMQSIGRDILEGAFKIVSAEVAPDCTVNIVPVKQEKEND